MATYKIYGHDCNLKECNCPYSQEEIDKYKPNIKTHYMAFAPYRDGAFTADALGNLLQCMYEIGMLGNLYHGNKESWLFDTNGDSLHFIIDALSHIRGDAKIVDIFNQSFVFRKNKYGAVLWGNEQNEQFR